MSKQSCSSFKAARSVCTSICNSKDKVEGKNKNKTCVSTEQFCRTIKNEKEKTENCPSFARTNTEMIVKRKPLKQTSSVNLSMEMRNRILVQSCLDIFGCGDIDVQDLTLCNITKMISITTDLTCQKPARKEISTTTETQVTLPRKSSEYDRKVLMKTLVRRRNALVITDPERLKKILYVYMALSNNLWLVEILTGDR